MNPSTKDISRALQQIETAELPDDHPRVLARKAINKRRQTAAINPDYEFNQQPRELRQVFYDATVRFSRRRWWSRWLR